MTQDSREHDVPQCHVETVNFSTLIGRDIPRLKDVSLNITFLLLIIITICFIPSSLHAKDTITWLTFDFPPLRIIKGEQKGKGIGDMAVDFLQERLTEYRHENTEVNLKRLFYIMKKEEKVCTIGIIKTPQREEFLHYSIPALIRPGLSIVINKDRMSVFGNPKKISLAKLIRNEDLKVGIVPKRSYTEAVDSILQRHKGQKNILVREGFDLASGLLKMLSRGHIDYIIEYPSQVLYISRQIDRSDQFYTIALEEAPSYTVSHVVCPKNRWGKRVIERMDTILKQGRPTPQYRSCIERWVEERRREEFREVYNRFLELE